MMNYFKTGNREGYPYRMGGRYGVRPYKQSRLLIILLALLICISCDRFDSKIVVQEEQEFLDNFTTKVTIAIRENNISKIMSYYAKDYLNDGKTRGDIANYLKSIVWSDSAKVIVTPSGSARRFLVSFVDENNDINLEWEDTASLDFIVYRWNGNQANIIEDPQQVVMVQSLTYLMCNSCPTIKQKLKEIEDAYPDNFFFLSYHSHNLDPLSLYNKYEEETQYWGDPNAPYVLIQGQTAYMGLEQIDMIQPTIENIITQTAEVALTDVIFEINERTITGSVMLSFIDLDISDLYLYYAVIEKETEYTYNYGTQPQAGNVVRGRAKHKLENLITGNRINFTLLAQSDLDDDTYLVLWVQRIENIERRGENDKIFNAVKVKL